MAAQPAPPAAAEPAPTPTAAPIPAAPEAPAPVVAEAPAPVTPVATGGLSFGGQPVSGGSSGGATSLADVPERPTDLPSVAERETIRAGLEADRAAAVGGLSFGGRTAAASGGDTGSAAASAPPPAASGQSLGTVRFAAGSAELPESAMATLREVANAASGRIRVTGYGAGDGAGLATERAQAVARALVGLGIDPSRITIDGEADRRSGITDGEAARAEIVTGG